MKKLASTDWILNTILMEDKTKRPKEIAFVNGVKAAKCALLV